jgi:hypothetical protein
MLTHQHIVAGAAAATAAAAAACCLQLLVLDEADEMLSMNFTEQIYNCYRYLPPDCQVRWTQGTEGRESKAGTA